MKQTLPENRTVSIRTFGYFDVFVGDTPIVFRNKKSKELLALLVDRKGGYVTSEEAISFLWEDGMKMIYKQLITTLDELGVKPIEAVGKEAPYRDG